MGIFRTYFILPPPFHLGLNGSNGVTEHTWNSRSSSELKKGSECLKGAEDMFHNNPKLPELEALLGTLEP